MNGYRGAGCRTARSLTRRGRSAGPGRRRTAARQRSDGQRLAIWLRMLSSTICLRLSIQHDLAARRQEREASLDVALEARGGSAPVSARSRGRSGTPCGGGRRSPARSGLPCLGCGAARGRAAAGRPSRSRWAGGTGPCRRGQVQALVEEVGGEQDVDSPIPQVLQVRCGPVGLRGLAAHRQRRDTSLVEDCSAMNSACATLTQKPERPHAPRFDDLVAELREDDGRPGVVAGVEVATARPRRSGRVPS